MDMEAKNGIAVYRERLNSTLASHDLANEENLKVLVKNQILDSSKYDIEECYIDNIVENKTKEVWNLIQMMRSVAMADNESSIHGSWRVKQDTKEHRVMYREGPKGSPFHTLLVEGYVDGPVDVCLCISMESVLYKKWWPQSNVPTFKVLSSDCLQRVGIGEQISLVRMKVSWPLATREAIVHYFAFEYFKDDLIIVLIKSISDSDGVDEKSDGFSKDKIPVANEVVRIDLVGGFAIQKVNNERSYFRTLADVDIKLDIIPPSLINFISRQLIGSGFKLYQKQVASVAKGDEEFSKALKEPLYIRIRESLYSANKSYDPTENESQEEENFITIEENSVEKIPVEENNNHDKSMENKIIRSEIQEIEDDEIESNENSYKPPNEIIKNFEVERKNKLVISRDVEKALGTLEKAISIFKEYEFSPKTRYDEDRLYSGELHSAISANFEIDLKTHKVNGLVTEESKNQPIEKVAQELRNSSSFSHSSRHKIAPSSPEARIQNPSIEKKEISVTENVESIKKKNKKMRFCCFSLISGQQMP